MASREGDGVLTGEDFDLFFYFLDIEELEENELVQQEFSEAIEEVGMIISSGYEKIYLNKHHCLLFSQLTVQAQLQAAGRGKLRYCRT